MKRSFFVLLAIALLLSCQTKQVTKPTTPASPPVAPNPLSEHFKFSFYISAQGSSTKPIDAWTIDTTGTLSIRTARRNAKGNYDNLSALATLDPPDMDTLRILIRTGKLYAIDSTDLTQQCYGDENYFVKIVPLAAVPSASLSFDA